MPSTYSQNLRVELIANGEQSGTWGNTTNVNLGTILDSAIAGVANITVSSTSFALTANNGAADQARNMIVQLTGSPGANFDMFVPPTSKFYVIRNATSGDFDVTVKAATAINGTTPTGGTTVTVQNGTTSLIFVDGSSPSNVREALTGFAGDLNIQGSLTVNGNTTLGSPRISGSYSAPNNTTLSVSTSPTAHGFADNDYVWLIVKNGNAKSGYYGPITVTSTTAFSFSYASATAAGTGDCAVTNDSIIANGVIRLNGNNDGVIIEGTSTLPALRITQTNATGAALLIDDAANPDSTPFLIDASGNVVTGNTAALTTFNNSTLTPRIQEIGLTANDTAMGIALFSATPATSGVLNFAKSAGATVGTYTAVASGEALGLIRFSGSNGPGTGGDRFLAAASIGAFADAATGLTDMPGRLVFSTVPDNSTTLAERMRINSAGNVIIGSGEGTTTPSGGILRAPNSGTGTGFTDEAGTNLTIAAGNGTGTGGSGSILFQTAPSATSTGDTANMLAIVMAIAKTGNVGIGSTTLGQFSLRISKNITDTTGSATAYGIFQDGTIQSDVTTAIYNNTSAKTEAATFTLGNLTHYRASESTNGIGAGSSITNQYGYVADSTLVSATSNYGFYVEPFTVASITAGKTAYGFYSNVNTATGGGTAWGYYSNGTANNYFASNLLIGTGITTPLNNGEIAQPNITNNRIAVATSGAEASIVIRGSSTSTTTGYGVLALQKTLASTAATLTATTPNSILGAISFDGVNLNLTPAIAQGAAILSVQDATATTSYVPAGLRFTTTNTTSGPLEAMRITSSQNVVIGRDDASASPVGGLLRAPNKTGTNVTGVDLTIAAGNGTGTASTSGSGSILFQTAPANTSGTTSTATTLATVMAIANTGNVGIGSTTLGQYSLRISKNITGNATSYGIYQDGAVQSTATSALYNATFANIASGTALTTLTHYFASQDTYTGTVTTQYGFRAYSDLVGATTNYGFAQTGVTVGNITTGKTVYSFYSGQDAATGGGTAYGFYAAGTAANYFNNLLIGDGTALATRNTTGSGSTIIPAQQIIGTTEATSALGIFNYSATTTFEGSLAFSKSLTGTIGTRTQTTNGTDLGGISFNGVGLTGDAAFSTAAFIRSQVDSTTLATGSVPGKLLFGTTNVDATAPVARMSLDNRGMLSVGTATASGAALSTTAPAKLFIDNATYTDTATAGTITHGAIVSVRNPSIVSSYARTYTSASTVYIEGAPTEGNNNTTITYPYALFIDSGNMRLDGNLTQVDSTATAIVVPLTIEGLTTATPANNITTALNFRTQTGATNVETGAAIRAIVTDVTNTDEDFDLSFLTMDGGDTIPTTATGNTSERLRLKSTGELQFNSGYGSVATAYGVRAWINFDGNTSTSVSGTYTQLGNTTTVTVNITAHGLSVGQAFYADITSGDGVDGVYTVLALDPVDPLNKFTYTAGTALNTSGGITLPRRAARAAGNFSTIVGRTATAGNYIVNFVNPMPDANYCVNVTRDYSSVPEAVSFVRSYTTAYVRVVTGFSYSSPTYADAESVFVTVFR